jgi:hypothetical protein
MADTIQTQIKIQAVGVADTTRDLGKVQKGVENIGKEAAESTQSVGKLGKAIKDSAKESAKELRDTSTGAIRESIGIGDGAIAKSARNTAVTIRDATGAFGDMDSAVATLAGSLGGAAGEALGFVATAGALAEAIPNMIDTIKSIPASLGQVLIGLGPAGAIATGAIIGVTLSMMQLSKEAENYNNQFAAQISARRAVAELISSDTSLEDAQARLAELKRSLEDERTLLAQSEQDSKFVFESLRDQIELLLGPLAFLGDGIARIAQLFTGFGKPFDEDVTDAKAEVARLEQETKLLTKAIADNKFAAGESTQATTEAAKATTQAAQAQMDLARATAVSAGISSASAGMSGGTGGVSINGGSSYVNSFATPFYRGGESYTGVPVFNRANGGSTYITLNVPLEATAIQPAATTNAVKMVQVINSAMGGY